MVIEIKGTRILSKLAFLFILIGILLPFLGIMNRTISIVVGILLIIAGIMLILRFLKQHPRRV